MKKILFTWLGRTDIDSAARSEAAAIASAVLHYDFSEVVILASYPQNEVDTYVGWLRTKTSAKTSVIYVPLDSPINHSEIYSKVSNIIGPYRKLNPEVEYYYHLSPGTPAMHSIWILLAKTKYPATLIESSKESGVKLADVPFEISAELISEYKTKSISAGLLTFEEIAKDEAFKNILVKSPSMLDVYGLAVRSADTDLPVYIEGESGTGKEVLANLIHSKSRRSSRQLISINCGAIPKELVESELFGHKKGSFTGADKDKVGILEEAEGGTIFLDEVGDLPLNAQVKLLRFLQEGEILPVGSVKTKKVNVRVISATNKNLVHLAEEGYFREDLFYRLVVLKIHIPALRDRRADLKHLIVNFEKEIKSKVPETSDKKFSPNAMNALMHHQWRGNIRELYNALFRIIVFTPHDRISQEDVEVNLFHLSNKTGGGFLKNDIGEGIDIENEFRQIFLHYYGLASNKSKTKQEIAKLLGFKNYQTLDGWVKKYS